MATASTGITNIPANLGISTTTGMEAEKEVPIDALKQINNESHLPEVTQSKPVESGQNAEESKPRKQAAAGADAAENKTEPPQAGDKCEHDSSTEPIDTDKPAAEDSAEPTSKKQKTDEEGAAIENDAPAPISAESHASVPSENGVKKKLGRRKTVKGAKKPKTPPDGVGSRTRSRTKAS